MSTAALAAISLGAVFLGAMPDFFGYMAYSAAVLLPLSVVLTLVFLR